MCSDLCQLFMVTKSDGSPNGFKQNHTKVPLITKAQFLDKIPYGGSCRNVGKQKTICSNNIYNLVSNCLKKTECILNL